MTHNHKILAAAGGSLALLLGAWGFQMLGYAPCKMCIWQRWPHGIAAALGAVALVLPLTLFLLSGALAAAISGAIGIFHTGVEKDWWEGPTSCTSGDISGLSTSELTEQILASPLVRCDEVAWAFLGLSMASWNAILSFALVAIWLSAAHGSQKPDRTFVATNIPAQGSLLGKPRYLLAIFIALQ